MISKHSVEINYLALKNVSIEPPQRMYFIIEHRAYIQRSLDNNVRYSVRGVIKPLLKAEQCQYVNVKQIFCLKK